MEAQNFYNRERQWCSFFYFTPVEKAALIKMAAIEIKKRKRKIIAIENHPNNEGQAKYWRMIEDHKDIIEMLEELTNYKTPPEN